MTARICHFRFLIFFRFLTQVFNSEISIFLFFLNFRKTGNEIKKSSRSYLIRYALSMFRSNNEINRLRNFEKYRFEISPKNIKKINLLRKYPKFKKKIIRIRTFINYIIRTKFQTCGIINKICHPKIKRPPKLSMRFR